ncbi:hypothetical protein JTE90_006384 [Oedothorax gibbosus]|uniref:SprT-like domain-containing protein n=1 Tax=Oedothorax gibbosus TaxID=931172 RepID=A0AAV6VX61_9ARAC|nr:hypothetical protein JTE90_006384 [Oedothorax gibbosus]
MDNEYSYVWDENVDPDEEFLTFLTQTKENFAKLSLTSNEEKVQEDELDLKFMKFLKETKENLSSSLQSDDYESPDDDSDLQYIEQLKKDMHFKNNEESFSLQRSTSLRRKRSHSMSMEDDKENEQLDSTEESKSCVDQSINIYDTETKTDFIKNRNAYGYRLFHYFNRKVFNNRLPSDTPVVWSDLLRRTAGKAHCKRVNDNYSCKIELSSKVLTTFDRLRDTLLHEMCHAAVWIVNHSRCCHGPLWQTWAKRCKIIFPKIDLPTRCHNYEIAYKYMYNCSKCHYKIGRHSKSINTDKVVCPYCRAKLVLTKS